MIEGRHFPFRSDTSVDKNNANLPELRSFSRKQKIPEVGLTKPSPHFHKSQYGLTMVFDSRRRPVFQPPLFVSTLVTAGIQSGHRSACAGLSRRAERALTAPLMPCHDRRHRAVQKHKQPHNWRLNTTERKRPKRRGACQCGFSSRCRSLGSAGAGWTGCGGGGGEEGRGRERGDPR